MARGAHRGFSCGDRAPVEGTQVNVEAGGDAGGQERTGPSALAGLGQAGAFEGTDAGVVLHGTRPRKAAACLMPK
jgi:hypothetical protein